MSINKISVLSGSLGLLSFGITLLADTQDIEKPNIVFIYADDLGYGDVSCYGSNTINTPNINRLAKQGLRFTNAHSTSAVSTPSRYSLLTGEYAWRRKGTGIAKGNAAAIIETGRTTIATVMKSAGYRTGVVGKWHLGLGSKGGPDWNREIVPGPGELGFDYHFIIPSTGDHVPDVFVENNRVVGLDPNDHMEVSYIEQVGDWPTAKSNPELLKVIPSAKSHTMTIINGISRQGWMYGGKSAIWVDEDIADTITGKAVKFIEDNKDVPFFLYFSPYDIHVPRVPHKRFVGKSGMGPRGDAILEFDWSVGEIVKAIENLKLSRKTMIIVSSDNGPVLDDAYKDDAVEKLGDHKPAGPLRGGKYSAFEGGTRVVFIVRWKKKIKSGVSDALVSQVDLLASFAALTGQTLSAGDAPDSFDQLKTLLGISKTGRDWIIEQSLNNRLSIIKGDWKYIEPGPGPKIDAESNIETGNDPLPQLYNLKKDIGERNNVASENQSILMELADLLKKIKDEGRSRF